MIDMVAVTLHILCHLILRTPLSSRRYYYPTFTNKVTEAQGQNSFPKDTC